MKKLVATCALALFSFSAQAADMAIKAPHVAAAPAYDWTGFYIGGQGGFGWAETNWVNSSPASGDFSGSGGFGGGTAGFNWQSGLFVFGVEGDYSWASIDPTGICGIRPCSTKLESFATVRGRLGYAVTPTVLLYETAGWAYGHFTSAFGPTPFLSSDRSGWAAGAGVEVAFTPNLSGKIEYLHLDLGSPEVCDAALGCTPSIVSPFTVETVRAGLNYRFGWR